ncbi:MAG: hypothetical protein DMD53_00310 [Gemmatimonadetes bacterium]|nr:MAG: hypothetical protein DMD53_00310 [Gemmatimonadota bacterium]
MTKAFPGIVLLVLAASPASTQDWRAQLKADAVVIRGAKMIYDEVGLYKLNVAGYEPAQVQVKVHSEAPQGGLVSRDNFVSLTTLMFSTTFIAALSESYKVSASQFIQGLDYAQLKSAIGTPDFELNLTMTNEGMQFEVVNTSSGQKTRQTMTWDQVFGK